jgi:hypothetical protein
MGVGFRDGGLGFGPFGLEFRAYCYTLVGVGFGG